MVFSTSTDIQRAMTAVQVRFIGDVYTNSNIDTLEWQFMPKSVSCSGERNSNNARLSGSGWAEGGSACKYTQWVVQNSDAYNITVDENAARDALGDLKGGKRIGRVELYRCIVLQVTVRASVRVQIFVTLKLCTDCR